MTDPSPSPGADRPGRQDAPTSVPLEYRGREGIWLRRRAARSDFLWGLGIGAGASLLVWFFGWPIFGTDRIANRDVWLWVVPGVKAIAAIVCMCVARWRAFGAGLLVSIGLGMMIYFGSCAMHELT